jgi:hypothetical protein
LDLSSANREIAILAEMMRYPDKSYEEAEEKVQNEMILNELRELSRHNQNPLIGGSPPTIVVP